MAEPAQPPLVLASASPFRRRMLQAAGLSFKVTPSKVDEVLSLIDAEVAKLVHDGITERELRVASGYLVGALLLIVSGRVPRIRRARHEARA